MNHIGLYHHIKFIIFLLILLGQFLMAFREYFEMHRMLVDLINKDLNFLMVLWREWQVWSGHRFHLLTKLWGIIFWLDLCFNKLGLNLLNCSQHYNSYIYLFMVVKLKLILLSKNLFSQNMIVNESMNFVLFNSLLSVTY